MRSVVLARRNESFVCIDGTEAEGLVHATVTLSMHVAKMRLNMVSLSCLEERPFFCKK